MSNPDIDTSSIESILQEKRLFHPPADFSQRVGGAYIESMEQYQQLHQQSVADPEAFWAEAAKELHWFRPWDTVLEWNLPDAKWFVGGTTNLCYNCVDRHVEAGYGAETAIIWEGEPYDRSAGDAAGGPEQRTFTYADLQRETARFANVLKSRGVKKGDVVTIYMGMVPELAVAMLACARIGAVHSIIFGGFSASAIADRVEDARSRIIVTCDGGWRRGKIVPLKDNVDEACTKTDLITDVIVLKRCGQEIAWHDERDVWWHDLAGSASDDCQAIS